MAAHLPFCAGGHALSMARGHPRVKHHAHYPRTISAIRTVSEEAGRSATHMETAPERELTG